MTPLFRRLIAVLPLVVFMLAAPAAAELREVRLGDRFYLIDLPRSSGGAPMILALHGGGGDPAQFAAASGLGRAATAKGYAVVFPAGTSRRGKDRGLTWNGGYCCGYAARSGVDDAGFLRAVIADATARFGLQGDRVFLTGGTSHVPAVRALFHARFGTAKVEAGDELISIAKGLALIGARKDAGMWAVSPAT